MVMIYKRRDNALVERREEMTAAEKEAIMERSRETSARVQRYLDDPQVKASMERYRKEQALEAALERARAEKAAKAELAAMADDAATGKQRQWKNVAHNVTMAQAQELCRKAWDAPYFKGRGDRDNEPALMGVCRHKAAWLQQRLGGVVVTGWKPGGEHHAALLLPIDGDLFVADHGKVIPVAEYAFHFNGVYF
jgi:hypothetical protein